MGRTFFAIGVAFAGLSVALGAFGAHILRDRLSPIDLAIFQTGVQYQSYHGLALMLTGYWLAQHAGVRRVEWVCRLFALGVLIFSGSLYLLVSTGVRQFGAITPIGGVCFLSGWTILLVEAVSRREYSHS